MEPAWQGSPICARTSLLTFWGTSRARVPQSALPLGPLGPVLREGCFSSASHRTNTRCLNPHIGYENAAKVAHKAYEEGTSLRDACVGLGFLTPERFDEVFKPEEMV